MGRNNSEAWNSIHALCNTQQLDQRQIYEKAKLLLGIYRRVCWSTIGRAEAVNEDVCYYCGDDLDGALVYLETFAPEKEKQRFESRIRTLFETRWMMELVEQAMVRVKEFPDKDICYHAVCFVFNPLVYVFDGSVIKGRPGHICSVIISPRFSGSLHLR